ncbi:hypothetical protein H0O02_02910, partial [Candidatus Micrarchaeota archaeon]|nr:hypothetical protein [Candidatus Micrarchaeota archaeon]
MDRKILAGFFAILGLAGIGFAWYGFGGAQALPPGMDNETMKERMEACNAYFTS